MELRYLGVWLWWLILTSLQCRLIFLMWENEKWLGKGASCSHCTLKTILYKCQEKGRNCKSKMFLLESLFCKIFFKLQGKNKISWIHFENIIGVLFNFDQICNIFYKYTHCFILRFSTEIGLHINSLPATCHEVSCMDNNIYKWKECTIFSQHSFKWSGSKHIPYYAKFHATRLIPMEGIWANRPRHSFLVGYLNPYLQGTNVQVGSP